VRERVDGDDVAGLYAQDGGARRPCSSNGLPAGRTRTGPSPCRRGLPASLDEAPPASSERRLRRGWTAAVDCSASTALSGSGGKPPVPNVTPCHGERQQDVRAAMYSHDSAHVAGSCHISCRSAHSAQRVRRRTRPGPLDTSTLVGADTQLEPADLLLRHRRAPEVILRVSGTRPMTVASGFDTHHGST